jgi:DNA-binding transcriptional LysR family regulator
MTAIRDLNLLHALDALLQEESVTAAAQRARLTTPAMSRALGRLREALSDPLLVRAGRRMVLTPYAVSLRERVHMARAEANGLLAPASHASLADIEQTMVVRCSDAVAGLFVAPLYARMARVAPGMSVHFAPEGDEDVAALRDGRVDLDIGVVDFDEPELRTRVILRDHFVVVVGKEHALGRGRLTPKRLAAETHIVVSRAGKARGPVDRLLQEQGLERRVAAVVPTFFAAMFAASRSDLVTAAPSSIAMISEGVLPIRSLRMPFELPEIAVSLAWHPRLDRDPAHRWLREQIVEIGVTFRNGGT